MDGDARLFFFCRQDRFVNVNSKKSGTAIFGKQRRVHIQNAIFHRLQKGIRNAFHKPAKRNKIYGKFLDDLQKGFFVIPLVGMRLGRNMKNRNALFLGNFYCTTRSVVCHQKTASTTQRSIVCMGKDGFEITAATRSKYAKSKHAAKITFLNSLLQ